MSNDDPRQNHAIFERCWNASDVEGLLALYEPEAVYVGAGAEELRGHAAIRGMLEQMTALGIRNRLELLSLTEIGDLALERTRWTMQFPGEDGQTNEQCGHSTVVLRRQPDGGWKMIVDHPGID